MNSTAGKLLVGAIIIVGIGGFIFWSSSQNSAAVPVTDTTSVPSETVNPSSAGTTSTPAAGTDNTNPAGTPSTAGAYKDGTYTSPSTSLVYGNLQISVTIAGGKISDVTFLQAPDEQGHTAQVTAMSEPILKSEAIASQNANVDIVSGATQTSEAFQQALQAALTQAQA